MQYFTEYKFKKKRSEWVDADTAIRKIKKGKRILIGSGCAEPQHLVSALIKNVDNFRDNEIVHILTSGIAPYTDPKYSQAFRHNAFFMGKNVRDAVSEGNADYIPINLSEVPLLFTGGLMPLHAALIQVTPPDKKNMVSLGVSVDIILAAISVADIVIAQVNTRMPVTLGKAKIPISCIDYLVKQDEPLIEFAQSAADEISAKIGKHISRYVRDGDTLQLGIGEIPDAVLTNLKDKNDLGLHSEMVSDGIVELYKRGNLTNKMKGINKGKSIVSFVLASKKTFDVIHENPDFQFYPSEYTNDPFIICQNKNLVSINSAIQVDLTGQVCSDSIGTRFFSGFGGQVDFIRGAKRSLGGRSFLAFASTAKEGAVSKIVPYLGQGAGVVTNRADVHYIVTEYGVAYLHGKNIRERGLALVQIAHPKFRDELLDYLKQKHYVYLDQRTIKDDHNPVKDIIPFSHSFKDKTIYFRALRPSDERTIQDFFYSHDPQTIYQRYLSDVSALPSEVARVRVSVDYNKDMAIAGFDSPMPYAEMVCLGRYIRNEDNSAVCGFVVKESYQGLGIGTFLAECLLKAAKWHGVHKLIADVGLDNKAMMKIYKNQGFKKELAKDEKKYFYSLQIKPDSQNNTKDFIWEI